jgi:hypothetical protein
VVAYFALRDDGGGGGGGGGRPPAGTAIRLSALRADDPFGTGTKGEHDELVPNATDGKGGTYWKTEHYNDAPSLGKAGVGLVLDAHKQVALHQIAIATQTPGFRAVIKGSNSPSSFATDVSSPQTVADGTSFTLTGGPYRYYEIWITRLGPGYADARINEVRAS